MNHIIRESVLSAEAELERHGARVELHLGQALPRIVADRTLLTQVVANLLQNAAEAMRDKEPAQRRTIVVTSEPAGADEVKVTVSDEGAGIPPEVREQLFTPFFSTKAEGLGLGLTICQSVVEAHGGRLWLDKQGERGGATFRFTLPTEAA
jgi:signal transduction histidine kinase